MTSTVTKPDARVLAAFNILLEKLDIHHAEYKYVGGTSHPQTRTRLLRTGRRLTRGPKLKQLKQLLGTDGYVEEVTWHPVPEEVPVIVVVFRLRLLPDDSIEFSSGNLSQRVGLVDTQFTPAKPNQNFEHVEKRFKSEAELVDYILSVSKHWLEVY